MLHSILALLALIAAFLSLCPPATAQGDSIGWRQHRYTYERAGLRTWGNQSVPDRLGYPDPQGVVVWFHEIVWMTDQSPVVDPITGTIYIGTNGQEGLVAIDHTGERKWGARLRPPAGDPNPLPFSVRGTPAIRSNGSIIVPGYRYLGPDQDGTFTVQSTVFEVRTSDGAVTRHTQIVPGLMNSPLLMLPDERIYVGIGHRGTVQRTHDTSFTPARLLLLEDSFQLTFYTYYYEGSPTSSGGFIRCVVVCFTPLSAYSGLTEPPLEWQLPAPLYDPKNDAIVVVAVDAQGFSANAPPPVFPAYAQALWRSDRITSIAGPVVQEGFMLTTERDKEVMLHRLSDQKRMWLRKLGAVPIASPAVASNTVLVTTANGKLFALAWKTGKVLWSRAIGGPCTLWPLSTCVGAPVAIEARGGNVIVVGSNTNDLYAFKLDGTQLWRLPLDSAIRGTPAVVHGRIYVATQRRLYAIR
jgi:outer membrane protein assembly factor BamB